MSMTCSLVIKVSKLKNVSRMLTILFRLLAKKVYRLDLLESLKIMAY